MKYAVNPGSISSFVKIVNFVRAGHSQRSDMPHGSYNKTAMADLECPAKTKNRQKKI